MRVLLLLAGLSGCYWVNPDGDAFVGDADCKPNRAEPCVQSEPDPEPDTGPSCDLVPWYADADGDGFGDGVSTEACDSPGDGFVLATGDCDDGDPSSLPGGTEVCDGADNDCDGAVDDDAADLPEWHPDADGDGFGDAGTSTSSCEAPDGSVADGTDCDDSDEQIRPGATEFCDGADNDCNGAVDDDAYDAATWVIDRDGDGYGDAELSDSEESCTQPSGFVGNAGDCDDESSAVSPAASEIDDNGVDDDCDDAADEGADCYRDADGDGYGDPENGRFADSGECAEGYITNASDCDDGNYTVNSGIVYDSPSDGRDADCDSFED